LASLKRVRVPQRDFANPRDGGTGGAQGAQASQLDGSPYLLWRPLSRSRSDTEIITPVVYMVAKSLKESDHVGWRFSKFLEPTVSIGDFLVKFVATCPLSSVLMFG
jgi:hypothetical protein